MTVLHADKRAELVAAVTARLGKRRASVFQKLGEAACRGFVDSTVSAVELDLEAGACKSVRGVALPMLTELIPAGLSFSDLRFFNAALREQVRAHVDDAHALAVGDWFYEHLCVCSIHYMVQREQQLKQAAAARDVERFESQLAELQVALEDKTELLEAIRQASVPIAPVVRGILVVPMVGVFDGERAEILTERLLEEISRQRARAAILDVSGVPVFDTDAAQLIIRLARSVRLIGAKVIMVGMSPDNARTLVELGVDLAMLTTLGTLQDGLAAALVYQRMKIVSTSR